MPLAAIAGIGAIGSIVGGVVGSNAAGHAADTQAAAANNAANLERQSAVDALNFNKQQYGNSLNLLSPFYNTGVAANSRLASLMGLSPNSGLPPGVINPNAPQTGNTGTGASLAPGFSPTGGGNGSNFFNPKSLTAQPEGMFPGGAPPDPNDLGAAGRFGMMSPDAFGAGAPLPTGGTTSFNTAAPINNTNTGISFNNGGFGVPGQNPGSTAGVVNASTGNVINANGLPGQVARTDGGGDPNNPTAPAAGGSFGSLAQGWNQTFQSPTDVTEQNDPGYQFRLAQGQQALQNSAAARGGLLSGGTAKALNDYAQGSASSEYGNVYNRALQNYNTNYNTFTNDQTNTFNRLASLSGQGQVSANNLSASGITAAGLNGQIAGNAATQIGQQYNNAGAANASGYVGSANAITGAIGGASNSLSTLAMLRLLQGSPAAATNPNAGMGVF